MNKARRKVLRSVVEKMEEVASTIEDLYADEQSAFDNLPESLQYSDKGADMEEGIDLLSETLDTVRDYIGELESTFLIGH